MRFLSRCIFTVISVCWMVLLGVSPVMAQPDAPSTAATPGQTEADDLRDPAAIAELRRATDLLTSLPRFHLRASAVFDVVQEDGRRLQFEKFGDIFIQRPNRLFADISLDDGGRRQFWYDGKSLSYADRSRRIHTQVSAPPTLDGMLDLLELLMKDPIPLSDLLYGDLKPLERRALEADIVGDSLVGGRPCRHLSFRGKTVDWQIWVEVGSRPFIRKLAISYREQPGMPQYVAVIDTWETPEHMDDKLFKFSAPEGSQFVSVMVPPVPDKGGQP